MRKITIPILILTLTLSCSPKHNKVERIMENGIEVILNHLEPYKIRGEPFALFLEEEFVIDTERIDVAEIGLTDIEDFDVDSNGNIYLLNFRGGENAIFKVDGEGNFVTSFGRKGQGPGELQFATYINISDEDEIVVIDHRRLRLLCFDTNGSIVREMPSDLTYGYANLLTNGNYLLFGQHTMGKQQYSFALLCDFNLNPIKELYRQNWPNTSRGEKRKATRYTFVTDVSGKNTYIGNAERGYEIYVFDSDGNLIRKIRKEYNPISVTEEFKRQFWERYDDSRRERIKKRIYFPEFMPPFQFTFTDEEGRLFVMTYEKSNNHNEFIHDVFNPEGIFIGRVSLDNFHERQALRARAQNGNLYYLRGKDSGFVELVVSKMIWE